MFPLGDNGSDFVIGIENQHVIHKNATMDVYENGSYHTENINDPFGNENLKAFIPYYVEELLDSDLPYARQMFLNTSQKAGSFAVCKVREVMNEIIKDEIETFLGFKLYPIVFGPNGYVRMNVPNMHQTYQTTKFPDGTISVLGHIKFD